MRALAAVVALAASVAAADATPPETSEAPSEPGGDACKRDGDCVITSLGSCCGDCCPEPHAASRVEEERRRRRCAIVHCAAPRCRDVDCAVRLPAEEFVAACRKGYCTLARAPECRRDGDCAVVYPAPPCPGNPCGCCANQPHAVPLRRAATEKSPTPARPAPGCAPCPPPPPASAICRAGRCALAPK